MTSHRCRGAPIALLAFALAAATACTGDVQRTDATGGEGGIIDADGQPPPPPTEAGVLGPGDPCPAGTCGDDSKLLCIGGFCRLICQGGCGDPAPECAANEGCYNATTFSSACLPTSGGQAGDSCDGPSCAPGLICVEWGGAPARCLVRCPGGASCPSGFRCDKTTQHGCEVCHP